ncbi:MAG: ferric reductase-like transmembrane domain-containing protein [Acidimicrobiia bacterium]|nr:ferric reductase-like transmembrane domain-containing protein [Acidimicrobiia bacterium]
MAIGGDDRRVNVAASNARVLWYVTRGSGVVTLLLLTAAVVLGVVTSVRWSSPTWPRFVIEWFHRNVSLVVLVFLAIHVGSAVIDGFVPLRWIDVVIPFGSGYKPLWTGLGAVAFDLLIAIVVTSLLRVRVGYRAWRWVHWAAYACWPLAVVHSLGNGSDRAHGWLLPVEGVVTAVLLWAVVWRVTVAFPEPVEVGHP